MNTLSLILDVVLAISGATCAAVAVLGYSSWRREVIGERKFNLAREILIYATRAHGNAGSYALYSFIYHAKEKGFVEEQFEQEYFVRTKQIFHDLEQLSSLTIESNLLLGKVAAKRLDGFIRAIKFFLDFRRSRGKNLNYHSPTTKEEREFLEQQGESLEVMLVEEQERTAFDSCEDKVLFLFDLGMKKLELELSVFIK